MQRPLIALLIAIFMIKSASAQAPQIVSGPMIGAVELRDAKLWLEVGSQVKQVSLRYQKKGTGTFRTMAYKGVLGKDFNPLQFHIGGLEMNTTYSYQFIVDGKASAAKGEFTTKDLWQYRKPAPDFSFLTGSCAFINERDFDRPGTPYGRDSSIFLAMAREKASFMLWLGDNWYTREVDYYSEWGLWYRASHDRSLPVLQPLLKAMPQFATWDDHDYGPNDIGKHYILKETSRQVMMNYWCNPSYGMNGEGIYTQLSWSDVDLFILDDRWWRSADRMKDSIDGKPNPEKRMLGIQQMEWLKNSLLYSQATFKIVVCGSQVLNPVSPFDKLKRFPVEYAELMRFLEVNAVNGVVFLTGDRHHSEVIKLERPGTYPLYDITVSPLTAGTHRFGGAEANNPFRVFALDEKQNYGRVSVTGKRGERKLLVEFKGTDGNSLGEWSVMEKELRTPK